MRPLISVITVTLNCATTLPRSLASLRQVKTAAVEYIVIDGQSTDGTLDILKSNMDIIDRLISEPDSGVYDAMNKGVRVAGGDFVIFLNGDDCFIPSNFQTAMERLPEDASAIHSFMTLVGSESQPEEVLRALPSRLPLFNSIPHPSTFVPRHLQLDLGFDITFRIVGDYDFFLRALQRKVTFVTYEVPVAIHQRGGLSGDSRTTIRELRRVHKRRLRGATLMRAHLYDVRTQLHILATRHAWAR